MGERIAEYHPENDCCNDELCQCETDRYAGSVMLHPGLRRNSNSGQRLLQHIIDARQVSLRDNTGGLLQTQTVQQVGVT